MIQKTLKAINPLPNSLNNNKIPENKPSTTYLQQNSTKTINMESKENIKNLSNKIPYKESTTDLHKKPPLPVADLLTVHRLTTNVVRSERELRNKEPLAFKPSSTSSNKMPHTGEARDNQSVSEVINSSRDIR